MAINIHPFYLSSLLFFALRNVIVMAIKDPLDGAANKSLLGIFFSPRDVDVGSVGYCFPLFPSSFSPCFEWRFFPQFRRQWITLRLPSEKANSPFVFFFLFFSCLNSRQATDASGSTSDYLSCTPLSALKDNRSNKRTDQLVISFLVVVIVSGRLQRASRQLVTIHLESNKQRHTQRKFL